MTVSIALALAFCALIGVLPGLLGGGGSILAIPTLVCAVGPDMQQAIPVSLLVMAVASAVGAYPKIRAGQLHGRLVGVFAVAGIPATFAGAALRDPSPWGWPLGSRRGCSASAADF